MPRRDWAPGERLLRTLIIIATPLKAWVRLEVHGLGLLEQPGAVLVVANHDSSVDPLAIIAAGMERRRPIRFLARANLWHYWGLPLILDGLRQIPIRRGAGDQNALHAATSALHAGEAVCIFPEGTISRGQALRARRGVARLAESAPEARIVLAAVTGGVDLVRFPCRPRVTSSCSRRGPRSAGRGPRRVRREPAGGDSRAGARPAAGAAGRARAAAPTSGRSADGILKMRWSRASAHRRPEQEPFDER